jgi:hypothetical protein
MERREHIFVESFSKIRYCDSTFIKVVGTVYRIPEVTTPTRGEQHDFNVCEKCKKSYELVSNSVLERFNKFPNCCSSHSKLAAQKWFNRDDFKGACEMLANKVIYTKQHIINNIDSENWFGEITNYIDYTIASFGEMPKGFGEPLFLPDYIQIINDALKKDGGIEESKKNKLLEHISPVERTKTVEPKNDAFELLIKTYERWLKVFPFELSFFKAMKGDFIKRLPILKGKPEYNPYSRVARFELQTEEELIKILSRTTKRLLHKIDTSKIYVKATDPEKAKLELEIILESHKVKQRKLVGEFYIGEREYINTVDEWLSNEGTFFERIRPTIGRLDEQYDNRRKQANHEALDSEIRKYGFHQLELLTNLSETNVARLIQEIGNEDLPYQIAMFDYLGFFDSLEKGYCNGKSQLYKLVAKILKSQERAVKGNILVLNPKSSESRLRYTSHVHKERVRKDYEKLK